MKSRVSIIRSRSLTDEASVKQAVAEAVSLVCDLREVIPPGQTVVLKPNVFAPQPPPITTDPRVVVAVGELAQRGRRGAGDRGGRTEHLHREVPRLEQLHPRLL